MPFKLLASPKVGNPQSKSHLFPILSPAAEAWAILKYQSDSSS
jgi:hypothetical protein